jgi:hypothetical protein
MPAIGSGNMGGIPMLVLAFQAGHKKEVMFLSENTRINLTGNQNGYQPLRFGKFGNLENMRIRAFIAYFITCILFISCKKNNEHSQPSIERLSYNAGVFYLKGSDYTVSSNITKPGTYTAFPDNLNIDNTTGTIKISVDGKDGESQTGLQYKIKFSSADGSIVDSTLVTIAGINYTDNFYNLSQGDSIISPIYNANPSKILPSGNYGISADNKLAINASNGQINIPETIRRGFFDRQLNASWERETIKYVSNDLSGMAPNNTEIVLYYYNSLNEVPSNVSALMRAHQNLTLGLNTVALPSTPGAIDNNIPSGLSLSRPRPPCIVIIAH